ncbi:glycosyltransferase [Malacoplasma penetrans]|uniref:Glycosyl transferase n=1 Tax=Malacoplasma penetrans (strain HF-2) TaxID=272633 RepID=Q8EVD1_MALP2|nr:glycosyltransferase [Malacoplasma penetrans]RXY96422.1 glycosyltransferase [Malacoplasma penetrans]BAC44425.1 putative glycosyl transferase [Malacoplasma penetrans HF-2]
MKNTKNKFINLKKDKKEKYLYNLIWWITILLWILVVILSYYVNIILQWENTNFSYSKIATRILIFFNFIFFSLLFCNNIKEFIQTLYYIFIRKNIRAERVLRNKDYLLNKSKINNLNYVVFIVYCTCNDFDEESITESLKQEYKNCQFFILDDSNKKEYKDQVNKFARKYENVKVIRRKNNKGFKAGNINNFLLKRKDYDFFIILDADEIIPSDFVGKSLMYFEENKELGILQAKNLCTRQTNWFDYIGSYIHNYQWQNQYNVRNSIGMLNLCGHGAMIKRECYEKSGGFPEILLEDWALTFQALKNNFLTAYANNIVCYEKFPSDYISFKKRQFRWTMGGVECFKKIGWKIFFFKAPFFKKIDIFLNQASFFITIFSLLSLVINISILYPLNFSFSYFDWYILLSVILTSIPLINLTMFYWKKVNFFHLVLVLLFQYLVYLSLFTSSITAVIKGLFGKRFSFFVTPKKEGEKVSIWYAIKTNIVEIIVSTILLTSVVLISIFIPKIGLFGLLWVFLTICPLYMSIVFTMVPNIKINNFHRNNVTNQYSSLVTFP